MYICVRAEKIFLSTCYDCVIYERRNYVHYLYEITIHYFFFLYKSFITTSAN